VFAGCVFKKMSIQESMRRASIAGSLACRSMGAQAAMPRAEEIDDNIERIDLPKSIQS
jgi:sugar/nucleoside kinase (ribokinase family)